MCIRDSIMVPHITGIIFHEIHHLRTKMRRHRIYIIIVIGSRLSLQNITIIQQYQILFILFALFLHERINTVSYTHLSYWSNCLSIAAIICSVVAICVSLPSVPELGIDYIGVIVGILSLLVTMLIGWQIWNVTNYLKIRNTSTRTN